MTGFTNSSCSVLWNHLRMKWIIAATVAITVGAAVIAITQAIDEQSQKPLKLVGAEDELRMITSSPYQIFIMMI